MVHALSEVHRLLVPGGTLIDLRPVADHWLVEVMASKENWVAWHVEVLPMQLADDDASTEALVQAEQAGWFVQKGAHTFDFGYYWDKLEAMRDYIAEEWNGYIELPAEVYKQAQSLWAQAGPGKQVRLRLKMHLGLWQK